MDDPWLLAYPCEGTEVKEQSLRGLLLDAHQFRDLVVDFPTQKPALFRQVLLPVVLHALGRPRDTTAWVSLFQQREFTQDQRDRLDRYLDEHRHLFELFDDVNPFAQVANLEAVSGETKGTASLVVTAPTGNNVPLFSSRSDADPLELTPAQAARWLIHAHCWDTAAIKTGAVGDPKVKAGKTTGNPVGPLGQLGFVMPVGSTLYDTLLLNLPSGPAARSNDRPQWTRRNMNGKVEETHSVALPAWQPRAAEGLLDLWTWQSRRIRLFPEYTDAGVRVSRVIIAAGDRLSQVPDFEPHTAWTLEATGKTTRAKQRKPVPPRRPRRHQPGKAVWRGLDALLAVSREDREAQTNATGYATSILLDQLKARREEMPLDYPLQIEVFGVVYGNQSAIVEDVITDSIPLPLAALSDDSLARAVILEVVSQAEDLANTVNHLSADLRRALGGEPIPWDKGQRPGEVLLHALDDLVRRLLAGLRAAGENRDLVERGHLAWEQKAFSATAQVAERLLGSVPGSAFLGHTIQSDREQRTYRLATAEAGFWRQLDRILWRAAAERKSREQDGDQTTKAEEA
ncbi:type I-E CRISPR-associated protein Cse1/CasA [Streptoalloteichus tenebrarius]|uniref:type I-E CRISPR-associated protein Cse1/CasA n=1 Tax=Streptoalloteichus tenebrarius (strain ATCC 17920 / DSM 40477 / JCM 4838 / CBS 697.72 / NBRC 16177 / NCIMB 11028 / NRRL B-12390 / A12253. 1 / ISP 5477) TaxID=1933 RepID=UPI0020A5DCAE|nr:type I-E CRISPR-associated protein Cse1/CasA [Streptoalloteichus tenebrarius]